MFSPPERRLYDRVLAFKAASPDSFLLIHPSKLLVYLAYLEGASNATSPDLDTGVAPSITLNDLDHCFPSLIAYIQIEQARLRASMGGDRSPDTATTPSEDPGDPEPFDEFTGPTGGTD